MSKVEKWKTSGWDRSKVFADKAKNNCENICIIGYSFVSLQHSCKIDIMQ